MGRWLAAASYVRAIGTCESVSEFIRLCQTSVNLVLLQPQRSNFTALHGVLGSRFLTTMYSNKLGSEDSVSQVFSSGHAYQH
jgi:hypothetical protein